MDVDDPQNIRPAVRDGDHDDDDMPELQSISDLDDQDELDDDESAWTDMESEDEMPPLEPTSGSRRPRSRDDGDEERDRRPPSQRVNSPMPPPPPNNINNAAPPPPNANAAPPPPRPNLNGTPTLAQFFNFLAQGLAANPGLIFGNPPPPPKDSPENAARILAGLERVPEGLIRRLERESLSSAADDVGAVGGDCGCAICWDRLLDGDGAEFAAPEPAANASDSAPSDSPEPASDSPPQAPLQEGIIVLPCSHLFHASCLVPWFSRHGQTTCPTCRFDVDPEGIIWFEGRKRAHHAHDHGFPFPFPPPFPAAEPAPDPGTDGPGNIPDLFNFDLGPIPEDAEVIEFDWTPRGNPPTFRRRAAQADNGDDDMPPLEPIPGQAGPTPAPAADDMPPLEPVPGRQAATAPAEPATTTTPLAPAQAPNDAPVPPANPAPAAHPHPPPPAAFPQTLHFGVDILFGPIDILPTPPQQNGPAQGRTAPAQPAATSDPAPQPQATAHGPTQTPAPGPAGAQPPNPHMNPLTSFAHAFRAVFGRHNVGINAGAGAGAGAAGGAPTLAQMFRPFVPGTAAQQRGGRAAGAPGTAGAAAQPPTAPQAAAQNEQRAQPAPTQTPAAGAGAGPAPFVFGAADGNGGRPAPQAAQIPGPLQEVTGALFRSLGLDVLGVQPVFGVGHARANAPGDGGAGTANPTGNPANATPADPNPNANATGNPAGAGGANGGPLFFDGPNVQVAIGMGMPPWLQGAMRNAAGPVNANGDGAANGDNQGPRGFVFNFPPPQNNPENPRPNNANANAAPTNATPTTDAAPHMNPTPNANPQPQAANPLPNFPFPFPFGHAHAHPHPPSRNDTPPPPPQEWSPPPAPGPTLRDRVERLEREAGLRCWDSSCGVGPSDDEPFIEVPESARRTLAIKGADGAAVCTHTFHPSCLVSAQRARFGWMEPVLAEGKDTDVEVACSVCRAVGTVTQTDWLEGCILPLD